VELGTVTIGQSATTPAALVISGGNFAVTDTATNSTTITTSGGTSNFAGGISGAGRLIASGSASIAAHHILQDSVQLSGAARIGPTQTLSLVHNLSFDEANNVVHGTWDLGTSALVVDYTGATPADAVRRYLRSGLNSGHWNGPGLISSAAAAANPPNTAIGWAEAGDLFGPSGGGFQGISVDGTSLLLKYTYYGDSDLNGKINFDDYVHIDNGFNNHLTGWLNGDFNYDGHVDFDDYVLIDLAFNTQSGTLGRALRCLDGSDRGEAVTDPALRQVELHMQRFGDAYAQQLLAAVPEPRFACLLVAAACARRRSSRRSRA
jgi:hypothetical protein